MHLQRKGQDPGQIERLTLVVHRAIDFLAPHFAINHSEHRGSYPTVYLGPPTYARGEMGLPIQTQEGDPVVGHETGHFLHELANPEVTAIPQLFGSPEFVVCEAVATCAQTLYLRRPIPDDSPFSLAQLAAMGKEDGEEHFKELVRFTRELESYYA